MSKPTSRLFFAILLLVWGALWARPLAAQAVTFSLDPARTTITFTLGSLLHTVHGTFKMKRGTIQFDANTGEASGEIVVDVASGESGNRSRDRQMHRDVLESERYPEAVFTPQRIIGHPALQGESHIELRGRLQIHGTDHELELAIEVSSNGDEGTATTHFEVPYVKWGLKDPSTLLLRVDKHVGIQVRATGRIEHRSPS